MSYLSILIGIIIGALLLLLFRRFQSPSRETDTQAVLLQQQIESIRTDLRGSLQNVTENLQRQMATVTRQMDAQTDTVGGRLDAATRVIVDVQKNLGELGQATKEIRDLGQSVARLDEVLRAPKLRGGLGEYLLEDLLRQVLPQEHYTMQHRFSNGTIVDAVIRTSDRLAPVDSKFPLENFRKMVSAAGEDERSALRKIFVADVKKHIDAIASRYILPDEGTFPFALMYIPAENIYYEIIIRDNGSAADLYSYAIERRVVPVSPNTFYSYLQVITLGLRGLRIEEHAREIVNSLSRLQADLGRLREVFDTLGSHIDNAHKKYDDASKRLAGFETRFDAVAGHQTGDDITVNNTQAA
jgi:DNA recombination protein RmuC